MFAAAASDFTLSELDFEEYGANGVFETTRLDINLYHPKTPLLDVYIKFMEAKLN